ncbi:hypothetical protein [Azorhizobium caulinodans]|uniref:hypothetical protein n=1 Tax=Azorhizobium caulinodans TaxID=7 RepID=UPI002FBEAA8C
MGTVLTFKPRPVAKRPLSPASLAAPALMAGVVFFTVYAAAVMSGAAVAANALNTWRR